MHSSTAPGLSGRVHRFSQAVVVIVSIIASLLASPYVRAVPPLPDELVNGSVEMLAVFDLGQVTPAAIDATGREIIENLPELGDVIRPLRDDHEAFVNAGGRYVIMAAAFSNDAEETVPMAAIFVDAKQCDEQALTEIIMRHAAKARSSAYVQRSGDWFFIWQHAPRNTQDAIGDESTSDMNEGAAGDDAPAPGADQGDSPAPAVDPVRSQYLRSAVSALEGRAVGIVMIPPQEFRDEMDREAPEMDPGSPDSIPLLMSKAHFMYGWIDLGHNPAITGVVELPEAAQAAQMAGIIQALPAFMQAEMPEMEGLEDQMPPEARLAMKFFKAISCVQAGNRVTVSIGQAHLRGILDEWTPIIVAQQEQARKYQAMSQGRQIGMSIHVYMSDHNNQWPDSLDDLVSADVMTREQLDEMLTHPITGEKNAFKYMKPNQPMDQIENPSEVAILYELKNGAINQDGCVVYADGHAEFGRRDH